MICATTTAHSHSKFSLYPLAAVTLSHLLRCRRRVFRFALLSKQAKLAYTGRADRVHRVHDLAIIGADVRPQVDFLLAFRLVLELRSDLRSEVVDVDLVAAKI